MWLAIFTSKMEVNTVTECKHLLFVSVDYKYDFSSLSFPLRTGEVNRRKQTDLQRKTRKSLVGKVKQDLLMTYLQSLHLEWNDARPELLIAFLMLDT